VSFGLYLDASGVIIIRAKRSLFKIKKGQDIFPSGVLENYLGVWYKSTMKRIFISYSHKDGHWKDRLVKHLTVLSLEGFCEVWDDRRIDVGDDWKPEIEKALNEADIVILMVSTDFLVSNFIRAEEVPMLLKRRKTQGLWVIPLFVKPCPWKKVEWLNKIQGEPRDGKTLEERDQGGQAEKIMADLAEKIAEKIQRGAQQNAASPLPQKVSQPDARPLENPFTETYAVRDENRFIGRENELRKLKQMLTGGSVSLQGDHKIGKSSLLWKLAGTWPGPVIGPLNFQTKHWDEMVEEISIKSGKSYKSKRDFRDALINCRALVLLDEMELGPEKGLTPTDCSLMRGCLDENRELKIVIASRKPVMKDSRLIGVGSPFYNICLPFILGPLGESDARRLLAHPWAKDSPAFDAETCDRLLDISGCHPFKLQRAAFHRFEALSDPGCDWESAFRRDMEQML